MRFVEIGDGASTTFSDSNAVVGSSLIYDREFSTCFSLEKLDDTKELLADEVAKRLSRVGEESGKPTFKFNSRPSKLAEINREIIPLNLIAPYNYFHFLISAAPPLLSMIEERRVTDGNVIVTGVLHPNLSTALKIVTNGSIPVLEGRLGDAFFSRSILAIREAHWGNELVSGEMPELNFRSESILRMRERLRVLWDDASGLKLFVVRQSTYRNVLNISELISVARRSGYKVVMPERLSFIDQVKLFSRCSHVVGPTGAWLANLLFVPAGARCTVLYPHTCRTKKSFWSKLGDMFGIKVEDFYSSDIILNRYQPIHSNFSVSAKLFAAVLGRFDL